MYKKTKGLVLREVNYKEADKILTVLTADEGKITVSARGCRRKNSRIAAASQLFSYAEMTLFHNRGRWSLNETEILRQFSGLREDIAALSLAAYFTQLLEVVSEEDSPNPRLLSLGLLALDTLSRAKRPHKLVKAAFELRLLCLAGFAPMLDACVSCRNPEPPGVRLDLGGGGLVCDCCGRDGMPLFQGTLAAMRHVTGCEDEKVFSFVLGEASAKSLGEACEAYLLHQLDRGFHTLEFYNKIKI